MAHETIIRSIVVPVAALPALRALLEQRDQLTLVCDAVYPDAAYECLRAPRHNERPAVVEVTGAELLGLLNQRLNRITEALAGYGITVAPTRVLDDPAPADAAS